MKTLQEIRQEIQEIKDSFYGDCILLSEAFHAQLQAVLDSNLPVSHKNREFIKTARNLLKTGQSTGLLDDKPKKGSSRAVFIPRDPKPVTIDGEKTAMHTATKIAFPGTLDRFTGHDELLGEMQNKTESDHYSVKTHSVLTPTHEEDKFEYNPHGILAPLVSHHPEHHYVEFGKISKIDAKSVREATKNEEFPKGLTHEQIYDATNHFWNEAHGFGGRESYKQSVRDDREKVKSHPLVESLIDFVGNTGTHPGDFHKGNFGIWEHPVTGKKHLVLSDYGYNAEIAKHYQNARKKQSERY